MNLRLQLAYDGSHFSGWQSQADGSAVQDKLEAAFRTLVGHRIVVHGAGRTDAGVHALGQVAHAEVPDGRPAVAWKAALNGNLPREVRVLASTRAPKSFHARFSATGKVYRYRIWTDPALPPHEIGRAWHLPIRLDRTRLREAARHLEGRHDFRRFSANRGTPMENTIRSLHHVRVRGSGSLFELEFEGDGFLYRMVRILTGTLVKIGSGQEPLTLLDQLFAGEGKPGRAAPAHGLWLVRVRYAHGTAGRRTGTIP